MPLTAGSRLGSYEVIAPIGAGGMGEVYRARDTRLGRDVALKILPEAFAADSERLARFEREAKTLAALNHPNIAHIYDAGTSGATAYLAMELVIGDDLSTRIERGPIPASEALPIARQIIDALEAAHELGIIHRDLKPANIKVRDDGTVKVLDFGLAKALGPDGPDAAADAQNSPTLTARATKMGIVLGTAAYMAPEQARGRPVDRRADIWAFGVVLYEMLTGRRAFEGEDISVTLASVIKDDARWDALPTDVPVSVRRLLKRCLEKDPKRRLSAIGDARFDLQEGGPEEQAVGRFREAPARSGVLAKIWPAFAGAAVTAIAGYLLWQRAEPARVPPPIQFSVQTEAAPVFQTSPRISPDGRLLAYAAPGPASSGRSLIWIRPMDGLESGALAGTEGAGGLFWSPTSDVLGYVVGTSLYRVSASGGAPQRLCEIRDFSGATWTRSGDVIVASFDGLQGGLWRVPGQGGEPVSLPRPKATGAAVTYLAPVMLSDDKRVLYQGWSGEPSARALYVGTLDGAEPIRLIPADGYGEVAPGYLLFGQATSLYAQPLDETTLKLSGSPVRIADGLPINELAAFSVSRTGVLAYRKGESGRELADLVWLDRAGKVLRTVGESRVYGQIRLSHDDRKIVFESTDRSGSRSRLSILDLGNGVSSPLTDEKLAATDPVWSRSGQKVAFVAFGKGNEIFTQQIGSASPVSVLESAGRTQWLDDWSPDETTMLLHVGNTLYSVTPGNSKSFKSVLDATGPVDGAHFSPDGRWVSYQVGESAPPQVPQVWIASLPDFDQQRQVSLQGGGQAVWSGDSSELFYLTPTGKLMAVHISRNSSSGALDPSAPVEQFPSPLSNPMLVIDQYWVTKDGQRFLFLRPVKAAIAKVEPITVVVNWTTRLAAGK